MTDLAATIDAAWDARDTLGPDHHRLRYATRSSRRSRCSTAARPASPEPVDGQWVVHQWLKKAVLLSFRLNDNQVIDGGSAGAPGFDKVPSKFAGWDDAGIPRGGLRASGRESSAAAPFVGRGAVLMPSFVNIGAHVGEGAMIDTWADRRLLRADRPQRASLGGAGIGGVLEPLQANPVVIEDNCFIGARAEVAEGVIVREGAVLSMGVYLGASTKIVDRATGEQLAARCPPTRRRPRRAPRSERRPQPLLRGDRQARRRPDPRQDRDQRAAAGLKAASSFLAEAEISPHQREHASVVPASSGRSRSPRLLRG
jgi:2,3,4,5-tetrahydropyridine-2-carboxylate N-succinyltransferase